VSWFTARIDGMENTRAVLTGEAPKAPLGTASGQAQPESEWRRAMTLNEPDAETWRRLFASLTGDSAIDAPMVREFCDAHDVTPARVMTEMHLHRRNVGQAKKA
jgi:hypothetical protein